MNSVSCIFCKIISQQIPSKPVMQTEHTLVIHDIHPQAPVHYLIMPKIHIEHLGTSSAQHLPHLTDMLATIQQLAAQLPAGQGFNLVANNGSDAGQSVPHLHWHFLSGKNIYTSGFSL